VFANSSDQRAASMSEAEKHPSSSSKTEAARSAETFAHNYQITWLQIQEDCIFIANAMRASELAKLRVHDGRILK
jgi:hypothetical protein